MPVLKCSNGKWKVGGKGDCIYKTKKDALKAYKGYLAKKRQQL